MSGYTQWLDEASIDYMQTRMTDGDRVDNGLVRALIDEVEQRRAAEQRVLNVLDSARRRQEHIDVTAPRILRALDGAA